MPDSVPLRVSRKKLSKSSPALSNDTNPTKHSSTGSDANKNLPPSIPPPPGPPGLPPPPPPGPPGTPGIPPPPPGVGTFRRGPQVQTVPTKPLLKPPPGIKSMPWKRILVNKNSQKGKYWLTVDQLENLDLKQLENLFVHNRKAPVAATRTAKQSNVNIVNIDSKKMRNCEIFFRSAKLDIKEFLMKLLTLDVDYQEDFHAVRFFQENFLEDEEIRKIKESLAKNAKISQIERNMYSITQFPNAKHRIEYLEVIMNNKQPINTIKVAIQDATTFLEQIRASSSVKDLLSIILTLGNFLNGNNPRNCQADGFQMELLTELNTFRSVKTIKPTTILSLAIQEYIKNFTDSSHTLYMANPFPNPKKFGRLKEFSVEIYNGDLRKTKGQFSQLLPKINSLKAVDGSKEAEDTLKDFKLKSTQNLNEMIKRCVEVELMIDKLEKIIIEFINDFGDRAMEKEQNPSAKLFKTWDTFLDNVGEVWSAETKPKFDQFYKEIEQYLNKRKAESKVKLRKRDGDNPQQSLKDKMKRISQSRLSKRMSLSYTNLPNLSESMDSEGNS